MDGKELIALIEDANYAPRSYSGRGMYGKECVGIDLPRGTPSFIVGVNLAQAAVDDGNDDVIGELLDLDVKEDTMGMGMIVYFPDVAWPKGMSEDDSDVACSGCGCLPGDGRTEGCVDPDGCGREI